MVVSIKRGDHDNGDFHTLRDTGFGRQFAEAAARRAAAQEDIDDSLARLDAARRSLRATAARVAGERAARRADQRRLEDIIAAIYEDR